MKRTFKLSIFAFLLFGFFSCDTDDYTAYETWDADANEWIDEDEFATTYGEADYYSAWDTDGDGIVDEVEWEAGISTYYPAYDVAAYGDYDAWDVDDDAALAEDEFTTATYNLWDTDKDGRIEVAEYNEWYHDI